MPNILKKLNKNIMDSSAWLQSSKIPWVIAGPCSAESAEQVLATARELAKSPNVKVFRAGLWKPRTRPDTFEGVGKVGLQWLKAVKAHTSLQTTTEVANAGHVELCLKNNVDILWIGARTTVNPFLVQDIADALRGTNTPIMVKNPINAELGLWLGAIERLYNAGIRKIAAVHRGFSTYADMQFRNSPNWQIPIELKRLIPNLLLICDPSHIAGNRDLIEPLSQAALDLGIKALMIETHINPDQALSDAKQQVTPRQLMGMLRRLQPRDKPVDDRHLKSRIAHLRAAISQADSRIIQDLADRMKCVEEIGKIKQQHNIPVLQITRWETLLEDHISRAQQFNLDPQFVKALFELIHAQAVKKQL